MRFRLTQGFLKRPSVGRMFLLMGALLFCIVMDANGVTAQTADDHGDSFNDATNLPLGASIAGRIDPGDDRDVFKLDLSGTSGITDVWIYTTGDLDTRGWLYDSNEDLLVYNDDSLLLGQEYSFNLRRSLSSGVYYLSVRSWDGAVGDYTLHAEAVTDPGSTTGTAAALNLDFLIPGMIDTASDADYFRLHLAESKNLVIYALSSGLLDETRDLFLRESLRGTVLDDTGTEIPVNVHDEVIGFTIRDGFSPGTYHVKVTAPASGTIYPVPYTIHAYEDTDYTDFIDGCEAASAALNNPGINDPLYGCQWHLRNQGRGGEDINVEPVWSEGLDGEGVNIAVVDDTVDYSHEDLAQNINSSLSHDYGGRGGAYRPFDHHGTAVAGIIAARDNSDGVRGVAPGATVYGYNYLAGDWQQFQDINRADAMGRNRVATAVSNNSWGPPDGPGLGEANRLWELAVDSGIREGYDGKGTFYVFAGGNGGRGHQENPDGTLVGGHIVSVGGRGDDSNLDELANYYAVTTVCAVNDQDTRSSFSEKGANLWVCGPSNEFGEEYRGIVTTENSDRYRKDFGGTSAATPIVSGVAALLRDANPDLTWRDLKLILAASARKNDAINPGWEEGAPKYGADSAEERYNFNHEYGFGMVDAQAAVDLARGWTNAPPLESASAASRSATTILPPSGSTPRTVTTTLALNTAIRFTEFVEINTDFEHTSFRDMEIELVSPSGAVSKLAVPFDTRHYETTYTRPDGTTYDGTYFVRLDGEFRFGSARHLGEDPNGQWTLRLTDHFPIYGGTLRSWSIKVHGHVPAEPAASSDATLSSLTVGPVDIAGFDSNVTEYHVGVANSVVQASITATASDADATIDIDGSAASGGSPYSVSLTEGRNEVAITVTAGDGKTVEAYTVVIGRGVTTAFGWKATDDFNTLVAGNNFPSGLWSDGTTLWVANYNNAPVSKIFAYDLSTKARDESKDFNTLSVRGSGTVSGNSYPTGIWSDGTTMWVADGEDAKLYAYDLSTKARDAAKDFDTLSAAGNNSPRGIWSDGETMWVVDHTNHDDKVFAYDLATKERDASKEIDTLRSDGNRRAFGIWSDGTTVWVGDSLFLKLYAYDLATKSRDTSQDFSALHPTLDYVTLGIWSDGVTMWVTDLSDRKIYSYNMPADTGTPATMRANRSFSPTSVDAGGVVEVTITASGYGAFGVVVETLPAGFDYVSSSLSDGSVTDEGQQLRFILLGETSFTYTLTAPSTEGSYSFSGVLRNFGGEEVPVGGAATLTVGAAIAGDPLIDRYDANKNGTIDRSEVIRAINDYLFGGTGSITRADVIRLISLYLFAPSTPPNPPGPPTGLTASGNGETQIDLRWAAPTTDGGAAITGYRIEIAEDLTSWNDLVADTGSTATTYFHTSLTAGTTRHYRVSAINSAGTGPASNIATGTTDSGSQPAPDLVVETPTVDDGTPEAGAAFTLSATVRNRGDGASAPTTLRYYRSADSAISASDTPAGTDSVGGLNASETSAETIRLIAPDTPGTYHYGACVDAVAGESDPGNNCSTAVTVAVGAAPAPDLVVDPPSVSDSTPDAGASFTLSATVRNQGDGSSGFTTLHYYRSTDSTITAADTQVGTDDLVLYLNALDSSDKWTDLTAPETPGTYYYGACVDAVPDESDTTNNCSTAVTVAVGAAPAPDLVVETPAVDDGTPDAGAAFTLSATVRNRGDGASAPTTLRYYRSTDSAITSADTAVGTDAVGGLDASGTSDESITLTAPDTPGTYHYGACVDAVAGETDPGNNCSTAVTVAVGAAPAPDLVVETPTVDDGTPDAGGAFTLSAAVRNQGDGASAPTTLRYYRSADSAITSADTAMGTAAVGGLNASGTSAESITLTAPDTPGTYHYGACVDAVAGESDPGNNCSAAVTVAVGAAPAPDLVVETPTVDDGTPDAGGAFTLSATVRNQGSGPSAPTTLRYYRSADSAITSADTPAGTDSLGGLNASETSAETIRLTAPDTPGTYHYGACVDAVVGETDPGNNCSTAVTVAVGAAPVPAGDYDTDNDGLIEISNLYQLNAVRWDPDGNGEVSSHVNRAEYYDAFRGAEDGIGCPNSGCIGYELVANLDFDTNGNGRADAGDAFWNGGAGWEPMRLGSAFYGGGHTIANLYINRANEDHVGLFGTPSAGRIQGVGLISANVTGRKYVGGLVGYSGEGTISDSYVTGSVTGTGDRVGGLIGQSIGGTITASYATGTVSGDEYVGGLVGYSGEGTISASYATGSVTGTGDRVGGLIGQSIGGTITASYATGTVSGDDYVGGLFGYSGGGTISASYATGSVTGTGDRVGGLIGNSSSGTITASYGVSGDDYVGGLFGYNHRQLRHWDRFR